MSAPVVTPFTQYSKLVTTRLRSRMHGQSLSSTFAESERRRRRYAPAVKAAMARVEDLLKLKEEHKRVYDPTLKARAVQQLQSLPLLSVEDDPHFTATLKSLRVAAYFNAVHAPATFSLLNHLVKHAYLLDGFHMYQIATILRELKHPRTAEVLGLLLPRIREVAAKDVTATEACALLEVLAVYEVGLNDTILQGRLTAVMQRTIKDLELRDVVRCVTALRCVPSALLARPVLQAADERLSELLEEAVLSLRVYTAEVFLCATTTLSPPASALSSTTINEEEPADYAHREQRRQAEKENRNLLLTNMRESRALIRELIRTATALEWAPRRVLNELARAVIAYTDPRPQRQPVSPAFPVTSSPTTVGGHAVRDSDKVVFEEEEEELAQLWADMPRLSPKDIAFFLRLLSATSYRHEGALRLLSSRIAASSPAAMEVGVSEASTRSTAAHTASLTELTTALESLAFFYMTDATATVAALVAEIVAVRTATPAFANPQQMLAAVDTLSRLFLSLVRLRYPPPFSSPSSAASAEEVAHNAEIAKLLSDDALQWFAGGAACVRQPLLTAQLLSGIAPLTGVVAALPPSAETASSNASTTRLITQLLEGLRRSGIEKEPAFSAPPAGGNDSQRSAARQDHAEAQRSVAAAVTAVKELRSTDGKLVAALQGTEALLLKLL